MFKKLILVLFVFLNSIFSAAAQDQVEMAYVMRENGKIYVVVAVAAVVMLGLIIYLISIDRKVSKLENNSKNKS
jgi:uncharacterized integral membrane protein